MAQAALGSNPPLVLDQRRIERQAAQVPKGDIEGEFMEHLLHVLRDGREGAPGNQQGWSPGVVVGCLAVESQADGKEGVKGSIRMA